MTKMVLVPLQMVTLVRLQMQATWRCISLRNAVIIYCWFSKKKANVVGNLLKEAKYTKKQK
jgi:hypothetical protein